MSVQDYKQIATDFLNKKFKVKEQLDIIRDRIEQCEKDAEGLSGSFGGTGSGQRNSNSTESRIFNMMRKKEELQQEAEMLIKEKDEAEKIVMQALKGHNNLIKVVVNVYFFEKTIEETAEKLGYCYSTVNKNISESKQIIGEFIYSHNISC